jgi:light-regulated signal transduction histidine kinase (bacteriophytochrome)
MIGASRDISKLKESEFQLKAMNKQLEKHAKDLSISNAELEQFAHIASHDLQEPLRMITSFLTQIEKKYGEMFDERGKQYIHFAVDGAKRMRQIILDLLEFSRVGRLEEEPKDVDLNEIMEDTISLYRKQIKETHAKIEFDNLPTIKSYKSPIRQAIQNLVSNALKYHRKGVSPNIKISVADGVNFWRFSVQDNGIGIDHEYFNRIFVIFQRLHNKDDYSGTGIGLAIVKKIVETLGGEIWITSEEGKGSVFNFTIAKQLKP